MRRTILGPLLAVFGLMLILFTADAPAQRKSVSGSEVTGTFRMNFTGKFKGNSNDIKIQALGRGRLRIAMDLVYPYSLPNGEHMANLGTLDGEAAIEADTGIYTSDDGRCKIKIKFLRPGTIKVEQDGSDADCGFGHNVIASGTYRKVSSRRPKFDEDRD